MFTLLAQQSDNLAHGLVLAIVGMAVVFTALTVLALVIAGLTRWTKPHSAPVAATTGGSGGLDGRTLAVITAAVAVGVSSPQSVRIERVQSVDSH